MYNVSIKKRRKIKESQNDKKRKRNKLKNEKCITYLLPGLTPGAEGGHWADGRWANRIIIIIIIIAIIVIILIIAIIVIIIIIIANDINKKGSSVK